MSKLTKQALVASFLKLAAEKPIEKITVRDIVDGCGLNRNTFYYYFSDIYALLGEVLAEETARAVARSRETGDIADGCSAIIDWIEDHRDAFRNVYATIGRESVEYAISRVLDGAIADYVRRKAGRELPASDVELIASVCRNVFFGALADWMKRSMRGDPREDLRRIGVIFGAGLDEAIRTAVNLPKKD